MTDIFAAYLFLSIAIVLLIVAIWSRIMWVAYIAAVSWIGCGVFFIIDGYIEASVFSVFLGLFCLLAGAATFFIPIIIRNRDKEEPKEIKITHMDHLAGRIEYYNKARSRFKPKSRMPYEPPQ